MRLVVVVNNTLENSTMGNSTSKNSTIGHSAIGNYKITEMMDNIVHNNLRVCALIPARGGSKRIPRKNIVDFAGKPLIVHTIEAALQSSIFERVVVSTEDEQIREIAEKYCDVDSRDPLLASDAATLKDVCLEFIQRHPEFDIICLLEDDCPLRTANDLKSSWASFLLEKRSMAMSVFSYGTAYPFWALSDKDEDGNLKQGYQFFFSKKYLTKSQNLPKVYCPSGAFKWIDTKKFVHTKTLYPDDLGVYVLNWLNAIDIDTLDDLLIAKMIKIFLTEHPHFFNEGKKDISFK